MSGYGLSSEDIERFRKLTAPFQEQMRAQAEQIARLQRSPQWDEAVRALSANTENLRALALRGLPALEAAKRFQASLATSGIREVLEVNAANMRQIQQRIADIQLELVTDPDAALSWAADEEVPDGWAAVPLVAEELSPSRRRELILRVATLLVTTYVYLAVLTGDNTLAHKFEVTLADLVAVGWLYHGVLSAIEDAERTLANDETED